MKDNLYELEQQYLIELKGFYKSHFSNTSDLDVFFERVFRYDWDDRKPRQMLFQVQHFVTLATDIDKIRPARDGLRILFLRCCMESLAHLSGMNPRVFYDSFATFFSEQGRKHILTKFTLLYIERSENGTELNEDCDLNIDDILTIIRTVRNMVVHEGNYWELQIFAHDKESVWLTHIETRDELLSKRTYENTSKELITYHFQTTLQFESFIYYFIEACIGFINNYVDKLSSDHCL